ncbi:integrase domain-containing protein [Neptuniibacter sp.]|uniref:integrase domain-containing protein n=1 Tax=Neptuniibacter sp. TaxID=1962643 RepID=UPI002622DB1C|nr:integrase domain-containing protein [Neptuniibacter sp.]MCP4595607.1 tyrosine-type recombinase/integrase [Neptuniibacter sp.]
MAKKVLPLTNTQVKNAKPKEKEYSLSDGDGLSLRVKPNGTKMWVFNYTRPHTSKRANISFGVFPEMPLALARKQREEARELLAQKIDPKLQRDSERVDEANKKENTLEVVTRQWFELKQSEITPAYAEDIIHSLENHVFPKIGNHPITDITAPLVIESLKPLYKAGKLEMIKRICSRLNQVMVYATNTGLNGANPLSGIRQAFKSPKVTNNPTILPSELPNLMSNIADANIRKVTRYLLKWQLHTMTRPGEAAGARWDEIDEENALWVIPAERMKKRRGHSIPLTSQTLSLLEKLKPISGNSEFLFPSDINPRASANNSTANVALKRMGYQGKLTAHGMRSIASTALNEQGFDPDIVEAALAHVDKNQVRATYNRAQYIERRRKMMEWWSDFILESERKAV